jgi:hypothetical protein
MKYASIATGKKEKIGCEYFKTTCVIIKYEQLQVVTMLTFRCDKQRRKAFISMQFCYQNWLFLTTRIKSIN